MSTRAASTAPTEGGSDRRSGGGGDAARRGLPPGPRGLPLIGNALAMSRNGLRFLTAVQRRHGDAATVSLGPAGRFFLFSGPAAVEQLLVTGATHYTSREVNLPSLPFLGDGLLNIDGDTHRRQRALVQPAFGRQRIEAYAGTMLAYTEAMLAGWRPGQVVRMREEMQLLTARIATRALLGAELADAEARAVERAFQAIAAYQSGSFGLPLPRVDLPFTAWGRFRRGAAVVDTRMAALIAARRDTAAGPAGTAGGGADALSMLLQARDADGEEGPAALTDRMVRDHAVTFFAAGHETTSNALTFAFHLLSRNPRAQARLRAELRAVCGGRPAAVADIPDLAYLSAVVKETLRLYPPAWIVGRYLPDEEDLQGYRLPAGAVVLASQWVIHRIEAYWPRAGSFAPERWLPGEGHPVVPFSYFPFGGGPRTCIGMSFAQQELHLILGTVLQRFLPDVVPGERLALQPRVTLRPAGGVRMRLLPAG